MVEYIMSASNLLLIDAFKKLSMECEDIKTQYYELIMAVGNKYPNESRHQTALRYIRGAEQGDEHVGMEAPSMVDLEV